MLHETYAESMFGHSSCLPSKPGRQQPNHRHLDERFTGLHFALIVLAHSAIAGQPAACPFYDPSFRWNRRPSHPRRMPHDLEIPVTHRFAPVRQVLASIGAVGPDSLEPRDTIFQSRQETTSTLRIMHICRRDIEQEQDTQGINQEMPLPTLHALMCIKAADVGGFLHGLDRLGVHNGCARIGMFAYSAAFSLMKSSTEVDPGACAGHTTKMIKDCLPRRKIAR